MNNVRPAEASFEENISRIAAIIGQDQQRIDEIRQMSELDFREWLDATVQLVAKRLGIAVAAATALVADVTTSLLNAGTTFKESFTEEYRRARRIKRRK